MNPITQRITLTNVREYCEKYSVELVRNSQTMGRWGIRAENEGGNNETIIDLFDLLEWLQYGPMENRIDDGFYLSSGDNSTDSK